MSSTAPAATASLIWYLTAVLLLAGCSNGDFEWALAEAKKAAPGSRVCFTVVKPEQLVGRFCLNYEEGR